MITWVVIIVLAVLAVVLMLVAAWAYQTAHRLDRLHVRYDLSWQALDGVLARRSVVARAVAVEAYGGGPDGCVLLFGGSDPADETGDAPRWWFTVGGAAQQGETLPQAAVRELEEETGLRVEPADMVGPVWRRNAVIDFNGSVIRSEEMF